VRLTRSLSALTRSVNVGNTDSAGFHCERLVPQARTPLPRRTAPSRHREDMIWPFYSDLKAYRCAPTKTGNAACGRGSNRIFKRKTGFVTRDSTAGAANRQQVRGVDG